MLSVLANVSEQYHDLFTQILVNSTQDAEAEDGYVPPAASDMPPHRGVFLPDDASDTGVFTDYGVPTAAEKAPYSAMQPSASDVAWDVPACFGAQLAPDPFDGSLQMIAQFPEKYNKLWGMAAERKQAVLRKFALEALSPEELFLQTHGPRAQEMIDYFYSGFDAEGKSLIRLFRPMLAAHYGW